MTGVPAADVPPAPRGVGWRVAWRRQQGVVTLAGILLVAGVVWIWAAGLHWEDAFVEVRSAAAWPMGLLVFPGLAVAGIALRRAQRLRTLLVHGEAAAVEILWHEPPRPWAPGVRVAYRFRGCDDASHEGRVRLPRSSPEAACLHRGGGGLVALCDRIQPKHNTVCAVQTLRAAGRA